MRASDGALIRGVIEPLIYGVRVWGNADNMGLRRGVKDTDVCRVEGCPARFMMYGSVADGGEKGNWCFETLLYLAPPPVLFIVPPPCVLLSQFLRNYCAKLGLA